MDPGFAWTPDSTSILVNHDSNDVGPRFLRRRHSVACRSVIAILDVETGAERVMEATSAVIKDMASPTTDPDAFRTLSIRPYHRYAYEGWSWTPDGRSVAFLERYGTHPVVVDVETGLARELPWTSDSALSWQRIAVE